MKKFIIPILAIAVLGLVFAWQLSQGLSARAESKLADLSQIDAQMVTIGESSEVRVAMTDEPPARVSMKIEQQMKFIDETQFDLPNLPIGTTAVIRKDSNPSSDTGSYNVKAIEYDLNSTPSAPGDMVLFRQTFIASESLGDMTMTAVSPSMANNGSIIFQTGELYAAVSANAGRTFQYIDPMTAFPVSYGGFCCNQVAIYVPSRDIFIWELEYSPSDTQGGALRIAIAEGSSIMDGVWHYYDLVAPSGSFYNFSDLALSNDFLYITSNGFTVNGEWDNSYVFRLPLDTLLAGGSITFEFLVIHQFGLRGVHGATDVFYWAAHNTTSQVRVYKWEESASGANYNDVNLSAAWFDGERVCPGPDGKNWCGGMGQAGRILTGWVSRGVIGFMWGSAQGGSFPYPYIEAVTINANSLTYLGRPYIRSNDFAFIYPGAAVNARGDLAVVFNYGGGALYPSVGYAVHDDFTTTPPDWAFYSAGSSTQGPDTNIFGRYNTVRAFTPTSLVWSASGYILNGCGENGCADPLYFIFGRERDMRSLIHDWGQGYESFVPLVTK